MTTKTRLMTADELLRMPDDGNRYELIRGELKKMAPTGGFHGKQTHYVQISLGLHVHANNLGVVYAAETGFLLETDPDLVLAPDVAFIRRERQHLGDTARYIPVAPDLAVEVISPSDRLTQVHEKALEWLAHGVRMVIVVNPRNRTVQVYRSPTDIATLTEADTLDGGDVVPGWRMAVADIFA